MTLLDELTDTKKKILIIGPHPDDVEFSTGRLMIRRKGKNTYVICVTDGRKGKDGAKIEDNKFASIRINESKKALKFINVKDIIFLGIHDQKVVYNPFLIDKFYLMARKISPDFILLPPWEGAHPDHDATHLFCVIGLKNYNLIEYGSYNYYKGKMRIQEFIPMREKEEKLIPDEKEQEKWLKIMSFFKSQKNLQKIYVPQSTYEIYRKLPKYDYSKLPYNKKHSEILRDLLKPIYPIAKRIIPKEDLLYYETWNNMNPTLIKNKLNHHQRHYKND